MLLAKMNILFYSMGMEANNVTGYSSDMVTSSTFKFDKELYFIGFFESIEDIEEYRFQKDYLVNIKFPSIDYDTYCKYEKKWEVDSKLEICMGNKIIGTGELMNWTFTPTA